MTYQTFLLFLAWLLFATFCLKANCVAGESFLKKTTLYTMYVCMIAIIFLLSSSLVNNI